MTATLIDALAPAVAGLKRLGVAVSGGSDSLGLLHLLHDLDGAQLHVVTIDHGLRPTSAGEALHVARLSEAMGLSHTTLTWAGWDGKGNLQDVARRTRYSMLAEWGRARGLDAIALGHTMDDAAETHLMRLKRHAGIDGLSAMAPRFERLGMTFLRPLLSCRREALRDLLVDRGVTWVEDPSNDDDTFDRVRARRALEAMAPLGLTAEAIAVAADNLSDARAALDTYAQRFARDHVTSDAGDLVFDRTAFQGEPAETRRRLLAAALRFVASAPYPPRRAPLDELLSAVAERRNATLHGCRLLVSDMTLRITREYEAVATLKGPTDALWDLRWRLDGPHAPGLEVRPLGEAVREVATWRETGLPRATLLASPAIWAGDTLVAAPVAGLPNGWNAAVPGCDEFIAHLARH
ncbi:MAG: tRNA lysidine(34) synthetase TilS [Paracoccaceae bacterium]|nr:tRNA lysidine(34) synthetase TilS [Paracoccaceae bacterium]